MEVVSRKGYNYQEISEIVRLGNEIIVLKLSLELSKEDHSIELSVKVTLSSPCLWVSFHPLSSLFSCIHKVKTFYKISV
jgi:hypothetical protein